MSFTIVKKPRVFLPIVLVVFTVLVFLLSKTPIETMTRSCFFIFCSGFFGGILFAIFSLPSLLVLTLLENVGFMQAQTIINSWGRSDVSLYDTIPGFVFWLIILFLAGILIEKLLSKKRANKKR